MWMNDTANDTNTPNAGTPTDVCWVPSSTYVLWIHTQRQLKSLLARCICPMLQLAWWQLKCATRAHCQEKKRDTSDDALDSCCPVLKRNLAPWQLPCNAELLQPQRLIVRRTHGISKMLACRPDLSPCTALKQSHAMLAHAGTVWYGVMQRLLCQPSLKNNARQRMKWCAQSS